MPGPYIHMSAMRAVTEALNKGPFVPTKSKRINIEWTGADTRQLGQLMKDHPNFASFGAIGPDLFFFLPDFRDQGPLQLSSVLVAVLRFLEDLYKRLDPYISKYEKYLGPISENMGEEISRLTGGLSEVVSNVAGELASILITALEDYVTQQGDIFELFSLGLNKGYDEQSFMWSDMLHYRQTGRFGRSLWKQALAVKDAEQRDRACAYVLGYLTHLATDVTGHALVNSISGGPFRLHWQRHHLVENHMDAFWCKADPLRPGHGDQYPQLTESALYYDIAFAEGSDDPVQRPVYPTGGTLRDNYRRRRLLDLDSALPSPLDDVIIKAMIDVFYQDGKHPAILRDNDGRPSSQLIEDTYDLLFRFLKLTTLDGFSHERPEPPDVWPNLDFPVFSDPHEDAPGSGGDDDDGNWWDDVLDFILSAVKVILYGLQVALWFASLPWALLSDLITYPLRLGLYYALELPLFNMLKAFRSVLVMTGYFAPMDDEIAVGLIYVGTPDAKTFHEVMVAIGNIFPQLEDSPILSEEPHRDNLYPRLHPEDEYKHPWEYPLSNEVINPQTRVPEPRQEKAVTSAGPFPRGAGPDVLFGNVPSDAGIRDALEEAANPAITDQIGQNLKAHKHLGDAVNFSQHLMWLVTRDNPQRDGTKVPLVDWNLDADRGYGYHDWDWNRNAFAEGVHDPEHNIYQRPCTWPSQAEDGTYHPEVPLQIHWVGKDIDGHELPDPGCQQLTVDSLLVSSFEGELPPIGSSEPSVFHYKPSADISQGKRWRGRITLTAPAPNNLFVDLTSSHPSLVSVPPKIQVLPGSISVDFEGPNTGFPNSTVEVTVTAALNGVSKTAKVIILVTIIK